MFFAYTFDLIRKGIPIFDAIMIGVIDSIFLTLGTNNQTYLICGWTRLNHFSNTPNIFVKKKLKKIKYSSVEVASTLLLIFKYILTARNISVVFNV